MNTAGWVVSSALVILGCSLETNSGPGPETATVAGRARASELSAVAIRTPAAIPDGSVDGVMLGPAEAGNEGQVLRAVGLMVDLDHPRTADLSLRLRYDQDGDGRIDAEAEIGFFRARRAGWSDEVANACPQSLLGTYYFCGTEGGEDPLDVFRGLPAGGSFYLAVADTLSGDIGVVRAWSVECARVPPDQAAPGMAWK